MDFVVSWVVGIVLLVFTGLIAGLVWLWREHKALKQQVFILAAQVQRNNDDLVGLCSAAVAVDKRLAENESQLRSIVEDGAVPQRQTDMVHEDVIDDESQDQGYQLAIKKIRQGATMDDLVKSCGLTRDEAVLLVRLHGKR